MNNRAGLILHEMIYEEMLSIQQSTSEMVRYFNALLASNEIANVEDPRHISTF